MYRVVEGDHHVEVKPWGARRLERLHAESFRALADEEEVGEVTEDGLRVSEGRGRRLAGRRAERRRVERERD